MLPHRPPVFSIKGGVGETWGAGGGLSLLAAVCSIRDGAIPPTTGTAERPDAKGVNIVGGKPLQRRPGAGLVLSMDMSGQNTAMLLDETP